ncbi:HNH endonuclease family protein [Bombiscardovia coagulans]|uniref:Deoxyribonuclease n=1 Tax=Bombiscardovia coagulans TaxID=686666 RepID=A0A261ESK7_9BIFI|nr:HNH endonuclease family protein [Bombiscardovia coagulans]OZG49842.1 deoxyribonuclease [Bombiscardovia coagulans]
MSKRKSLLSTVLDKIVAIFLVCVLVVILIASGGWKAISNAFGIGDADANIHQLTQSHEQPSRESDVQSLNQWLGKITNPDRKQPSHASQPSSSNKRPHSSQWGTNPALWQEALTTVASIPIAQPHIAGYNRQQQFGGWAPAASMCGSATTRDVILQRDLTNTHQNKRCQIETGVLQDPYTNKTIMFTRGKTTSSSVQIDHVVALLDAYASGARTWDQQKRVQYANSPDVLLAVDGSANTAKGAGLDFNNTSQWRAQNSGAPNIWMPDNPQYRCDYISKRVSIKHTWGLTMSAKEKQETIHVLSGCIAK